MKGRAIRLISGSLSKENAVQIALKMLGIDGGPGSGNFGHKGRPGQVGGSGPGGGGGTGGGSNGSNPHKGKTDLSGLAKSYHMKGIVEAAKKTKGEYGKFIDALSEAQRDAIKEQYRLSGSKEPLWEYAERLHGLLSEVKRVPPLKNKVVQGKDISETYEYHGNEGDLRKEYGVIDEMIEDVIHQQGFDGIPKVVSKEEFDKIASEHPEMPILFRAYTAMNPETLKQYDDDLEGGFWYVDCSNGGSQYGQGMYCAGVYQPDADIRVPNYDDPDFDTRLQDILVFKNRDVSYAGKEVHAEENGDLFVGIPYFLTDDNGHTRLIKMDEDSLIWEDIGKGGIIPDEDVDKLLKNNRVFECSRVDTSVYEDRAKKQYDEAMEGALSEMDHYIAEGFEAIESGERGKIPVPPGKSPVINTHTDKAYYYDSKELKEVSDALPEEGDVVVLTAKDGYVPRLYMYKNGEFVVWEQTTPGLTPPPPLSIEDVSNTRKWAKVEGQIEAYNPVGTARKMTLDPSAKIITYDEIRKIQNKAWEIRHEAQEWRFQQEIEFCKGKPEGVQDTINVVNGMDVDEEGMKRAQKLKSEHPDIFDAAVDFAKKTSSEEAERAAEARKYDKFVQMDPGVVAAMLGYDAINAEGHGSSMSYTVVLNRTKVILQKEKV